MYTSISASLWSDANFIQYPLKSIITYCLTE